MQKMKMRQLTLYYTCRLVDAAEDPAVTTGYTDYFPEDGRQTTVTLDCQGADSIQKCKEAFLKNGRSLVVRDDLPTHPSTPAGVSTDFYSIFRTQLLWPKITKQQRFTKHGAAWNRRSLLLFLTALSSSMLKLTSCSPWSTKLTSDLATKRNTQS